MSESTEKFETLQKMAIFGGLRADTLTFLLQQAAPISKQPGEYFFHEGDSARSLFVLLRGTVMVEKNWERVPVALRGLQAGDCFGEMSVLDLMPRSASVWATSDCEAIEISLGTLHRLYQYDLEQYAIVMMNMGREVSRRLRAALDRLFELDRTLSKSD